MTAKRDQIEVKLQATVVSLSILTPVSLTVII